MLRLIFSNLVLIGIITILDHFITPASTIVPQFFLSGVILNGILGGVSGKVGGVVGGKWKDINYLRGYAVPENPNTPAQQTQRSRMRAGVAIARRLMGDLIAPYWDPFYSSMSGFNAWISENIMNLEASTYNITTSNLMTKGTVLKAEVISCTYDTTTGIVEWTTVDNSNGTTGLETDDALIISCNKDGNVYGVEDNPGTRSDANFADNSNVPSGLNASDLVCFISFHRGTGSSVEVADSVAIVPTAA